MKECSPLEASIRRAEAFGKFFSSKTRCYERPSTLRLYGCGFLLTNLIFNLYEKQLHFFPPVSYSEVTHLIFKSLAKSCRLDPIPCSLLKRVVHIIGPTIAEIVNMSLSNGVFQPTLKREVVTPVLKKPSLDPEVLSNYRPVSGLSFFIEDHWKGSPFQPCSSSGE